MVTWFKARCAGGGNVTFGVYSVNDRPTLLWRGWPSVVFVYMMAAHRVAYVGRVR